MTQVQNDIRSLGDSIISLIIDFENRHPDIEVSSLPLEITTLETFEGDIKSLSLWPECRIAK